MRKKFKYYLIILLLLLFPTKSFSNEDVYWSNYQSGPFSIEAAKRQFGNRLLDAIEGLWFDDGLGTVQIIRDNLNKDKYKMFIIDIGYSNSKDLNGTWEATFFNQDKNYAKYSFFTRVWYDKKNGRTYKTQSGYAQIDAGTNFGNLFMDYDQRSLQGREMDHNFRRVWPANYEEYNKKILKTASSNIKTKWLNGKKYNYKVRSDYRTTDSSKRTCHEFISQNDRYYRCASSNGKLISYTKEYFNDQGMFRKGDVVRYRIPSDSWMLSAGFLLDKDRGFKIGGWIRRNTGATIYGVVGVKSGKFEFYQGTDGKIKNESGLEEYKVEKLIEFSKISFEESKKIKNDLDALLEVKTSTNKSNKNYSSKPKTKIKTKKTDFKQYWWVVVLIAVGAFFVYMHTTKDLPKGKKVAKKISKSPGAIKKFFNGDVDLTTSFWGVYFGAGLVLGLLSFALEKNEALAGLYALFILLPFSIYAMIGTWRSASKYKIEKQKKKEGTGWGTAAQVYIILSIIRAVVQIGRGLS